MSQAAFELQRTVPDFWKETLGKNSFQIYACCFPDRELQSEIPVQVGKPDTNRITEARESGNTETDGADLKGKFFSACHFK